MQKADKSNSKDLPVTSSAEVRRLVGAVADHTVTAILDCQASVEDLEIAAACIQGEGGDLGRDGHPIAGKVAQLYDILRSDALYGDDEER
ncbi:MAG TPA: hypothetical protein VG900_11930 [Hyphomicrobiaceae bacterium]|nr:hypothetical protein [Hyphomicrobiaceae bacterium]